MNNIRTIAITNKIDNVIVIVQLIGILISGFLPFRVLLFAFLAINKIIIPVSPPEIVPPIPRIVEKLVKLKYSANTYITNGIKEVNKKSTLREVLKSFLKVSCKEYDKTKNAETCKDEVSKFEKIVEFH